MSTEREKTGVPIGSFAINPANGERLPIWIADYVLAQYGTGAIMAVPASDERDWQFARRFNLPIRVVVRPPDAADDISADQLPGNTAYVDPGIMVNSGSSANYLAIELLKVREDVLPLRISSHAAPTHTPTLQQTHAKSRFGAAAVRRPRASVSTTTAARHAAIANAVTPT